MRRVHSSKQLYRRFTEALRIGKPIPRQHEPDASPPSARRKHYVQKYRRWLRPYLPRLALVFMLALVSAVLVLVGLYVRLTITETPVFQDALTRSARVKVPMFEVFRRYPGCWPR